MVSENAWSADSFQQPIRFLQAMIVEGVRAGASEMCIEPAEDGNQLRYRINGEWAIRDRFPKQVGAAVISRIKILAGIDLAENRLPQEGHFEMNVDRQRIAFHVSIHSRRQGESALVRLG